MTIKTIKFLSLKDNSSAVFNFEQRLEPKVSKIRHLKDVYQDQLSQQLYLGF